MGKGLYRAWKGVRKPMPKPTQKHAGKVRRMKDESTKFDKQAVLRGDYD